MTSLVIIKAHCATTKEVFVAVYDKEILVNTMVLQDGENTEIYVHDERQVTVNEVLKSTLKC